MIDSEAFRVRSSAVGQPVGGAVELEVQLLHPVVVLAVGRGVQTGLQGLQSVDVDRGCDEGRPGCGLSGQQRLRRGRVTNVLGG